MLRKCWEDERQRETCWIRGNNNRAWERRRRRRRRRRFRNANASEIFVKEKNLKKGEGECKSTCGKDGSGKKQKAKTRVFQEKAERRAG